MTPARRDRRSSMAAGGRGRAALFGIAASVFVFGGLLPAPQALAEEPTLFADLTTPELLELTADLGDELRTRGVMPDFLDPSGDYARHLAVGALQLRGESGAFVDEDGARYRIDGVRRLSTRQDLRTGPLGDLSPANYDYLVVVVFRRDFQIDRAFVAPIETVRVLATSPDPTAEPRLVLSDVVWNATGVVDVTGPMFLAASREQ